MSESSIQSDTASAVRPATPEALARVRAFHQHARKAADSQGFDYAIDLLIQAIEVLPDEVASHQLLREVSLRRRASGGKDLSVINRLKVRSGIRDDFPGFVATERLLAFDPGNMEHMARIVQAAPKLNLPQVAEWSCSMLENALRESRNPEYEKYIILKDAYKATKRWAKAVAACQRAMELRPGDTSLGGELNAISAQLTMDSGNYATAGSFIESVRDLKRTEQLLEEERDVRGIGGMARSIQEAERRWLEQPDDIDRVYRYVDLLEKTEDTASENRAIELLEQHYQKSRQFRLRQRAGRIRLTQMRRIGRALERAAAADPSDASMRAEADAFAREQLEAELAEYRTWCEAYPTDLSFRFEVALRLFQLGRFTEAIPLLQSARSDPKVKIDSGLLLGRSFLQSDYVQEAVETLQELADDYPVKGDDRAKELNYWLGRALEHAGKSEAAARCYSQVAQWDFGYSDVQQRLKAVRAAR